MGIWSSIKKFAKKIWRGVKAFFRLVLKVIFGLIMRVLHGIGEIFLFWLKKNFRIQVFILRDEKKMELVAPALIDPAINNARAILEREFNVRLKFYGNPGVQTLRDPAPTAALDIVCNDGALGQEFGEAGEYFANHQAGWVGIPISLSFPVSVFIVRSIVGRIGCAKKYTDYVWLAAPAGVTDLTTLAHELGHTSLLSHRDEQDNLLYRDSSRGTSTTWWQRRVFRTSRHCTFW